MRAGQLAGHKPVEIGQILLEEARDPQLMDALKRAIDERGGALLVAALPVLGERAHRRTDDLGLPVPGDLDEQLLLALVELVERGFGDARLGGQRVQRRPLHAVAEGVALRAFKQLLTDRAALLLGEGKRHENTSLLSWRIIRRW